jgi:hypothetical protein
MMKTAQRPAYAGKPKYGKSSAAGLLLNFSPLEFDGSMASQLAREAGAYIIGTGRAAGRQTALAFLGDWRLRAAAGSM